MCVGSERELVEDEGEMMNGWGDRDGEGQLQNDEGELVEGRGKLVECELVEDGELLVTRSGRTPPVK